MCRLDDVDEDVQRPVFKESNTTTKVRVVFDASYKPSSVVSLKATNLVGPVVQKPHVVLTSPFAFSSTESPLSRTWRRCIGNILHYSADEHFL